MIKVVCWNIGGKINRVWDELFGMKADLALLQEVRRIPSNLPNNERCDPHALYEPWNSSLLDRWPTIVQLSDRVDVQWFRRVVPISEVKPNEMAVSGIGTVAAARIESQECTPFIAASMYARWILPHPTTYTKWTAGYPDGSAHRILSDLSTFIGSHDPATHRILAAGDLNTCYGTTNDHPRDLPERGSSIFNRFLDLGFEMVGPQSPHGRMAEPPPSVLPPDSRNVPTFALYARPENAVLQLGYVFASRGFHQTIHTRALNEIEEWGSSDHCRIVIEIE